MSGSAIQGGTMPEPSAHRTTTLPYPISPLFVRAGKVWSRHEDQFPTPAPNARYVSVRRPSQGRTAAD